MLLLTEYVYHCHLVLFNPFVPEFIIPAEPLNAGHKMVAPGAYTKRACNAPSSAFFWLKRYSKDFIVCSCVPEELQVVLVFATSLAQ